MKLPHLTPGRLFGGDYRVLEPLAHGGMGSIYVVEQISTGRHRALKLMRPDLIQDKRSCERFIREARIGSRIDSAHIVDVIAAGVDEPTNTPWLVMELLDGENLYDYSIRSGPITPTRLLAIFGQLCHALQHAHDAGVVHRDLKPENIFLARSRRSDAEFTVKVLDFGIAKFVSGAMSTATQAIGTPLWMAPEQTDPSATITPATDIWPLGLIAFFLLSGREYWRVANSENPALQHVLAEVLTHPIEAASARSTTLEGAALPLSFDPWFARCVDRDPASRFENVTATLAALSRAFATPSPRVAPTVPMSAGSPVAPTQLMSPAEADTTTLRAKALATVRTWALGLLAVGIACIGVGALLLVFGNL